MKLLAVICVLSALVAGGDAMAKPFGELAWRMPGARWPNLMHLIDCTTKKLASMRNLFARKHVVHEAATHFVNAFHQDLLKDAKTLKERFNDKCGPESSCCAESTTGWDRKYEFAFKVIHYMLDENICLMKHQPNCVLELIKSRKYSELDRVAMVEAWQHQTPGSKQRAWAVETNKVKFIRILQDDLVAQC